MDKFANLNMLGKNYKVRLVTSNYQNNNATAVFAMDGETEEMFCTLSVNLPASSLLPEGTWYGKHWSENTGFLEQLVEQGVIEQVDAPVTSSGFVSDIHAYKLV